MGVHVINEQQVGLARCKKIDRQINQARSVFNFATDNVDDGDLLIEINRIICQYHFKKIKMKEEYGL